MKVAILGESDTDEAIFASLFRAVGEESIDLVPNPPLRSRGWPSVRSIAPTVIRHVYFQTSADGLVILFDSNGSPVHTEAHESDVQEDCRTCQLVDLAANTRESLPRVHGRPEFNVVVATAVPCVEAWLVSPHDHQVSEAAWLNGEREGRYPYTRLELKRRAYGTSRPTRSLMEAAVSDFQKSVKDSLEALRRRFPMGLAEPLEAVGDWGGRR